MGVRREVEESYGYGLWNEIFLDCGNVETMSFFLYTIIILKVGPLNYNILIFILYGVTFQKLTL